MLRKSKSGEYIDDLCFFFQILHMYTARTSGPTDVLTLKWQALQYLLKLHQSDEDIMGQNALTTYKVVDEDRKSSKSIQRELWEESQPQIDMQNSIDALRMKRTALYIERSLRAAANGDQEKLQQELQAGSLSVNCKNRDDRTCLHLAASNGHLNLVKLLLEQLGADISALDCHGNTALNDAGELTCICCLYLHSQCRMVPLSWCPCTRNSWPSPADTLCLFWLTRRCSAIASPA